MSLLRPAERRLLGPNLEIRCHGYGRRLERLAARHAAARTAQPGCKICGARGLEALMLAATTEHVAFVDPRGTKACGAIAKNAAACVDRALGRCSAYVTITRWPGRPSLPAA